MEIIEATQILKEFTQTWKPSTLSFSQESINKAKDQFETIEFPTTRNESWKYTRVTKISKKNFTQESNSLSTNQKNIIEDAYTLVFVNGIYDESKSSPIENDKFSVVRLSSKNDVSLGQNVSLENEAFNAINTLFAQDGAYIKVAKNVVVDKPIQVLFITTGDTNSSQIRNYIATEEGAQAKIVMAHLSENAKECFSNVVSEVIVGANSNLVIDKLQYENDSIYHIATEQVSQHNDSYFKINTLTLDGALVRNNLNIDVVGQNCDTNLNGVYLTMGNQHVDNHSIVDHRVPNCESNELYKGVMDDKSTAVFNGKVFVRKDAQKINAFQSNGNVLLSDNATVNSKPELEIYADDVKCSHGSTTGQLDEEAVFYLRSRGISEKAARKLMISAFVGDALEKIENEDLMSYVNQILADKFGWAD
ncbi:MAG: Fe-S cluster assembly protein SufD [Psychromonas sp.]|jgi:Fe-S cluster assembly protein SufD